MLTRSIVIRDPFVHAMNRWFNDSFPARSREWATVWGLGSRLPMDVYEDAEGYTLVAIAPGVKADEIQIETEGSVIHLSGETIAPAPATGEQARRLRSEIGYGKFKRSFELPEDIEADKIEAQLENGVLTVRVPKAEAVKPRTIPVRVK